MTSIDGQTEAVDTINKQLPPRGYVGDMFMHRPELRSESLLFIAETGSGTRLLQQFMI